MSFQGEIKGTLFFLGSNELQHSQHRVDLVIIGKYWQIHPSPNPSFFWSPKMPLAHTTQNHQHIMYSL